MIECKEINDYIDYVKSNPNDTPEDIKLLIKNIVLPTFKDETVFFAAETYYKCLQYTEKNYYPLFFFFLFFYAFVFMYRYDFPVFSTLFV